MNGLKHLVQCRCFLPQFKRLQNPILHKFVVFSIFDDKDEVIPKFVQCPNCGVVHKITNICISEIQTGRDELRSMVLVDDIKLSLSEKLIALLETNDVAIPTWEEAQFIVENKQWGRMITLTSERIGDSIQGKCVRILSENLFKVESFTYDVVIKDTK